MPIPKLHATHHPQGRFAKYRSAASPLLIPQAITDWTYGGIKSAIVAHDMGQFSQSAILADEVTRDALVAGVLNTRIAAVVSLPLVVSRKDTTDGLAENVEKMLAQAFSRGEFARIVKWGILMGWSYGQIVWDHDESGILWPTLTGWEPHYVYYDLSQRGYTVYHEQGVSPITSGEGAWALHVPSGSYRGWLSGLIRSLAPLWLARNLAMRDWLRYSEVHGLAIRKIKAPADADEELKNSFFESVRDIGSDATILCPTGVNGEEFDLQLVEATGNTYEAFKDLIERIDKSISIAILGQTLTTEVSEGSFAAAKVHNTIRRDYLEMDMANFAETLQSQLVGPFCEINYGIRHGVPKINFIVPEDKYTVEDTRIDKAIDRLDRLTGIYERLKGAGANVDINKLFTVYQARLDDQQ